MTDPGYDRVDLIRSASDRIADVATADSDSVVPRYEGWTVGDLVIHTGRVHRRTTRVVNEALMERPDLDDVPTTNVVDWFREGAIDLAIALERVDPNMPCWGFGPEPVASFWVRRMALETAVHRWDAESAVGDPMPFAVPVSVDGIDEVRHMWLPWAQPVADHRTGSICAIAPNDASGAWTLIGTEAGYQLVQGLAPGAPLVTGPASDLYMAVLGRAHGALAFESPATREAFEAIMSAMSDASR